MRTVTKLRWLDIRVLRIIKANPGISGTQLVEHRVSRGSIFPTIGKLLKFGLVVNNLETPANQTPRLGRKYCYITEKGEAYLDWVDSEPEL